MTANVWNKNLLSSFLPANWQEQEAASYSTHFFADPYSPRRLENRAAQQKLLLEMFRANLQHATQIAEEFRELINAADIDVPETFLRVDSIEKFSLLFVVGEDDFISDRFLDIIGEAHNKSDQVECDTFHIEFYFTYHSESLNLDCIAADGFNARYKYARSRKT